MSRIHLKIDLNDRSQRYEVEKKPDRVWRYVLESEPPDDQWLGQLHGDHIWLILEYLETTSCPSCQKEIKTEINFCQYCGTKIL